MGTTGFSNTQNGARWYDLFSRGARDWLRHNEKVRDAVRSTLPELISNTDILSGGGSRKVSVPVKFLEHYRFRLREDSPQDGVGQGDAKPGDILGHTLSPGEGEGEEADQGQGGNGEGGLEFRLELQIDDIVDWLWEELNLPHLTAKAGALEDDEFTREGWDRRGARSRLDRRRSLREAIKRRSVQPDGPAFTNEDLRYRQLVMRRRPSTQAVVFFAMDVSSSMGEQDRKLAKTFFFWVIQGLRRQYNQIELVFIAHTIEAWEFAEEEFFLVKGYGGTVASSAFKHIEQIIEQRYDPAQHNIYLFYASDGENYADDHTPAMASLERLASVSNYIGYIETTRIPGKVIDSETGAMIEELSDQQLPVAGYPLHEAEDVWDAIRAFFQHQLQEQN